MSRQTLIGILSGFLIVTVSIWATARDALVFINLPSLLIVVGGTVSATLISFSPRYVLAVWRSFISALKNERTYTRDDVEEIVLIAKLWHGGELHRVEDELDRVRSPFLRTGLQLLIDGSPIDDILSLLEWRIERLRAKERAEAGVFRTMGSYAPAFGMLGTLLGLVNMLYEMSGKAFDQIGLNMAVALITTFYGLILANLVFKPIAAKLEERTEARVRTLSMVLETIQLLAERRTPSYIRETMNSFLAEYPDEVGDGIAPAAAPKKAS